MAASSDMGEQSFDNQECTVRGPAVGVGLTAILDALQVDTTEGKGHVKLDSFNPADNNCCHAIITIRTYPYSSRPGFCALPRLCSMRPVERHAGMCNIVQPSILSCMTLLPPRSSGQNSHA